MIRRTALAAALGIISTSSHAHDGEVHAAPKAQISDAAVVPLPFDVGGPFALTDQFGTARTQEDPDGQAQLLFFGYANCPSICSVAMPTMATAIDILAEQGLNVRPVMITVDPDRDTAEGMIEPLSALHPSFVGLTGTPEDLASAYDAFAVEHKLVMDHPDYGSIYAHGSFIYVLDAKGTVLSLLPPVTAPEQLAKVTLKYIAPQN